MGRLMVLFLALGLMAAPAGALASTDEDLVLRREEDAAELVSMEDDDDGSATGATGGDTGDTDDSGTGDSNDGTGSGHSAVSRDRDISRGDRTRDRTQDGPGDWRRDWSGGHTNDGSRNDTR